MYCGGGIAMAAEALPWKHGEFSVLSLPYCGQSHVPGSVPAPCSGCWLHRGPSAAHWHRPSRWTELHSTELHLWAPDTLRSTWSCCTDTLHVWETRVREKRDKRQETRDKSQRDVSQQSQYPLMCVCFVYVCALCVCVCCVCVCVWVCVCVCVCVSHLLGTGCSGTPQVGPEVVWNKQRGPWERPVALTRQQNPETSRHTHEYTTWNNIWIQTDWSFVI